MTPKVAAGLVGIGIAMAGALVISESVVSRQARPDRETVIYWEKWTGAEGQEMQKVVNAFNKSQDKIFVKYLSISGVDSKTMLATSGGNPPDIAGIWLDQVCQFSDAGALTDLTDMANEAGLDEKYYIKSYYDSLNYHGRLWAFPSTPASIALHVRTDLVPPQYASPETFPKTIEDFDNLMFSISKKDKDGNIKMAGFMPSNPGWWNFAWGMFFGGKLMDGDKLTLNSPENIRAFEWVAKYSKNLGSTAAQSFQSGFGNFASPQDPFMTGKVATELNGVWKAQYINVYKAGVKWFAVPFPYPKDHPELAGHSDMSQDVLTIPRGSKHVKAAFEFLKYVQSQPVMEALCIGHGKNSPLQNVSEHFFKVHPNPYIRLFDEMARSPKAFAPPKVGIWPQLSNEMTVAFQEVDGGLKSPKQALDDAQARVEVIWKTYKSQVLDK